MTRLDTAARLDVLLQEALPRNEFAMRLGDLIADTSLIELHVVEDRESFDAGVSRLSMLYAPKRANCSPSLDFGFADLLETFDGNLESQGQVYDPFSEAIESATKPTTLRLLKQVLMDKTISRPGLNFLDIRNQSGQAFTPLALRDLDLRRRVDGISRNKSASSRTGAFAPPRRTRDTETFSKIMSDHVGIESEWFIASAEGGMSPFHVDTAGLCTWIIILQGVKNWYWPAGDRSTNQQLMRAHGAHFVGYAEGILALKMQKGDLLYVPHTHQAPPFPSLSSLCNPSAPSSYLNESCCSTGGS